MKDLGEIGWFPGIQFSREGDATTINQSEQAFPGDAGYCPRLRK